jgi:pimeloyl-ACP methyl ester carboxylesterase
MRSLRAVFSIVAVVVLSVLTSSTAIDAASRAVKKKSNRRRTVRVVSPTSTAGTALSSAAPSTAIPTVPATVANATLGPTIGPTIASPVSTSTAPITTATIPTVVVAPGTEKPGTLLKSDLIEKPPAGSTGYRVRYRSTSVQGQPIEVTGLAFIPKGNPPSGGWPVLSYAHGTVGLADRCAPSRDVSPIENTIASAFMAAGIAVVASDFEGLGTPGRHPYLVGVSEGRGVLDIIRAAKQLPNAALSNRFVSWGHSQGGHASLFAGELAKTWAPELKLMGVVAGAPPSQLTAVGDAVSTSPFRGYFFMVAAGLKAADDQLDLNVVLTTKAQSVLPVVDTGCNSEVFAAFLKDPFDSLVVRAGLLNGPWRAALEANEPGRVKIDAPILIVHGDQDEQVPVETSATLKKKLCALGDSVDRRVYAGQDHGGAAVVSIFEVLGWIVERVNGLPVANKC